MDEIDIREFEEAYCCLYNSNDTCIGVIKSYLSLLDVRTQIKEKFVSGYYILWQDNDGLVITIRIDMFGELDSYPRGFYDESIKLLLNLV